MTNEWDNNYNPEQLTARLFAGSAQGFAKFVLSYGTTGKRILGEATKTLALQRFVADHAGPYRLGADDDSDVPGTLAELKEQVRDIRAELTVSKCYCEGTIFGGAAANQDFRAWHDRLHLLHNLDTDSEAEELLAVKHIQAIDYAAALNPYAIWAVAPHLQWVKAAVWAETYGQNVYYQRRENFPKDQARFSLLAIAHGIDFAVEISEPCD